MGAELRLLGGKDLTSSGRAETEEDNGGRCDADLINAGSLCLMNFTCSLHATHGHIWISHTEGLPRLKDAAKTLVVPTTVQGWSGNVFNLPSSLADSAKVFENGTCPSKLESQELSRLTLCQWWSDLFLLLL
jgi:hypothetical protein